MAAAQELFSFKFFFFYGMVLFLLFFYALAWQRILKYMPLTIAYANKGITIIWGIFWGAILFKEAITIKTIIGGAIILANRISKPKPSLNAETIIAIMNTIKKPPADVLLELFGVLLLLVQSL